MSKDEMAEAFWREQVARISHALTSLSETSERLATGVKDHVLFAGSVALTDNGAGVGVWSMSWAATCGSAEVTNAVDNDPITVTASTIQGNRPAFGQGVHPGIPGGAFRLLNIGQRTMTIYGTIGEIVSVQALTTGGVYGAGTLA